MLVEPKVTARPNTRVAATIWPSLSVLTRQLPMGRRVLVITKIPAIYYLESL